ncbi:membrane-associated phosphatidylinositol transfer protein 2-like isoform X1 [Carassius carassius]|uniref:membrane-associated phosphatidylinositol transfer protein 2-like isoform X1 n=1 Tax=Carassius carassius TaxID=217509 RepID=UPI002868E0D8|nr:membrane-associated phosphatidylinositol transfer protein 2-like isoform X1 [Carassius carassius]XP_059395127.1 membrane-associated phosphatidylinositol transfer protein 2-like isoform X1 [Carassius carassius]XP_059395128.1 membrane-associated phosphatidylinositol transfer protein 2-like isoform X1 [Carassius carassius]XP_059395129.1 membrane-associated phosphatidylinositol transfer protein 2-like isoform X1 [Carassius carassius]XP_059395130.1 membrane-associated phosphatidylinositol transfe
MLIKEYRIPMPMSVEEYRIAQLYMIQKKSREESEGEGSGVEILENRPYTDGPGGSGQYTHKVYHIGQHIPSWFRSILPKAALRVEEESWNAYPYTRTRYTCPFVEKFSIDIETYYKPDTGCQNEVFNMSSAERRQRDIDPIDIVNEFIAPHEYLAEEDPKLYKSYKTQRGPLSDDWIAEISNNPGKMPIMCAYKLCKVEFRYWGMQSKIERFIHDVGLRKVMVRAHRQAWCWQDEWYGLTMEDIRQLELETQLALAQKMAQYSCNEEGGENNGAVTSPEKEHEAKEAISSIQAEGTTRTKGDTLQARGELTKQWSTSSRSSRSSKRGGSPSRHSISEWRMQSIARDSEDSTDDEFFDAHEGFSDSEEIFVKEITKWSSNDLMDKIETVDAEEAQGDYQESGGEFSGTASGERLNEDCSSQQCLQPSKIHVLILVLHGGNILDTGSGDQNSKQGDVNTISSAFEAVMRVHYPTALGRIAIRLVPCPAVCVEAFSLVSNLSPYSYDEGCLSNSQDHIPLAALPLLATSAPQYQDAVATVIVRANQVYGDFIKSLEGATFTGQVCLMGDCVGGILGFDALCSSNVTVSESQNSSRRGSIVSVQDNDLLSPGIIINSSHCSGSGLGSGLTLEGSRHLSRSNIDIPRSSGPDDPKKQLPRKRSDSSTYELDTIKQHQAFLTSLHSSVLRNDPGSRRSSSSTMLEGGGALGKFDFEVSDFFLFGSPLGLVLALRKTVVPSLDVAHLRPACQQVYNLFHPADPSASRLEPLLEKRFHLMPPFSVPRYQRFPLGDGQSVLLVETIQSNPHLLLESVSCAAQRCQDGISETSIPVPVLNWQAMPAPAESDAMQSHSTMFADHSNPSSPASIPAFRGARRASETSIASQVSGLVDSYTASNIANIAQACQLSLSKKLSLLSQLALPYYKSGSRSPSPKSSKVQNKQQVERQDSSCLDDSEQSVSLGFEPSPSLASDPPSPCVPLDIEQVAARWWGTKRIDFALYCPDALTAFPTVALPHLFHASYWESTDVVSFLLRQVMRHENSSILELDGKEVSEFTPSKPREKWIRKRTHVKIRNVTANHRVNDAVFTEDGNQVVTGRFMYGPLDMVTLTGEKVDIHIMTQPPSGEWVYFSTELTNSSGRVFYTIPENRRLSIGVYPVKMVVRGDHTSADSYLTVLPRGTEFVVFSIDGSFAASVSIMGSDPKVRAGAVDVVRHWQDLGYLIVYVTGRPDMQKQRVVAWLSQHNFPHGIVSFCDGLVHDPLRHKANFLKSLITEAHMKIFAAYGSTKDISVYTSLGLPPSQIYIVGRPTKKMQHQCQFIADGYASHLSQLEYNQRSRPTKTGSTRMVLRKGSFGLGGSGDFLRKRNHLLRTISSQPTSSTTPVQIGRPERAQSQSECDRERAERAQRSMSIAAGCWGRTSRLESGALSPK